MEKVTPVPPYCTEPPVHSTVTVAAAADDSVAPPPTFLHPISPQRRNRRSNPFLTGWNHLLSYRPLFLPLFEWRTGGLSRYGRQRDGSKVTERNNPFMKPSSTTEVKLAWGRSACRLCPSSASAEDCTALFTRLPWEAHSWLIALELAVQHECSRREEPDECLNGAGECECLTCFSLSAASFSLSSISCFSPPLTFISVYSSAHPPSLCARNWIPSPVWDLCVLKMTWVKSESCWMGSCPFVQAPLRIKPCRTATQCSDE